MVAPVEGVLVAEVGTQGTEDLALGDGSASRDAVERLSWVDGWEGWNVVGPTWRVRRI